MGPEQTSTQIDAIWDRIEKMGAKTTKSFSWGGNLPIWGRTDTTTWELPGNTGTVFQAIETFDVVSGGGGDGRKTSRKLRVLDQGHCVWQAERRLSNEGERFSGREERFQGSWNEGGTPWEITINENNSWEPFIRRDVIRRESR